MPSQLESAITLADGTSALLADLGSKLAVVVTHPWGPLGGNMHNNVVVAVVLYFQRLGITTVRFNFIGSQFGRGYVQVQQVQNVVSSLLSGKMQQHQQRATLEADDKRRDQREDTAIISPPSYVMLVGYSYGSLITSSASAGIPQCIATISIAPPFGVQHWLLAFHSDHHIQQAASRENMARLFVIGDRDNFTSERTFMRIIDERFPSADTPSTTTGAVIKDADHFFSRREKDIMDVIGEWLLSTFPQCQGDLSKLRGMEFGVVL